METKKTSVQLQSVKNNLIILKANGVTFKAGNLEFIHV